MTTPKKPRKLPPRGKGGKFVKAVKTSEPIKTGEPELVEAPTYSPHRIGVGEPIDWQRELKREVMTPRRQGPERKAWAHRKDKLGWGVLGAGAIAVGYALSRLPSKGRHL